MLANKNFVLSHFKKCSLCSQFLTFSRIILRVEVFPQMRLAHHLAFYLLKHRMQMSRIYSFCIDSYLVLFSNEPIPFWNLFLFQNMLKYNFFFLLKCSGWVEKSFSCFNLDVSVCFPSIIRYYMNLRDFLHKCFLLHLWFYAPHPSEFRPIWLPTTEVKYSFSGRNLSLTTLQLYHVLFLPP